jgi:Macrocin-O-methyltransferase (TylF)
VSSETETADGASLLWKYRADPPQRYSRSYLKYVASGGLIRPNDLLHRSLVADETSGSDLARFYSFCLAFDFIAKEKLDGDIAELGVWQGGTACLLAEFARHLGRTAYLFDTFEGFDQADVMGIDAGSPLIFGDTSLDLVRANVGEENVSFIKGRFPETTKAIPDDVAFCLVHLDCDLYAPMRDALDFFYARLVPGGFLIVHDYTSLAWPGPERAVDRFLIGKSESAIPLPDNAGSVVIRKARDVDPRANWLMRKRATLLTSEWTHAGKAALSDVLGEGWSGWEEWGVWGVGERHELLLFSSAPYSCDLELDADVHAVLLGPRENQDIEVVVAGKTLTTWRFTQERNRAQRTVRIPAALLSAAVSASEGVPVAVVEFRPRSSESPNALDGQNADMRPLGLGLHAIRLRSVPAD